MSNERLQSEIELACCNKQALFVIHSDLFLKHKGNLFSLLFYFFFNFISVDQHVSRWHFGSNWQQQIFQVHSGRNENKWCVTKRNNEISLWIRNHKLHHWKSIFVAMCIWWYLFWFFFEYEKQQADEEKQSCNASDVRWCISQKWISRIYLEKNEWEKKGLIVLAQIFASDSSRCTLFLSVQDINHDLT